MSDKVFLHMDLDAFFASVEQHDNPSYRGKPVIVGGIPGDKRAVVSTASYEARKFGVHSAMPLTKAVKLCPNAIFVRGSFKRYREISSRIMSILKDFSPVVIQISIDEAFVDLTGTEKLFGPPEITAEKIKARIRDETGLTASVGIAGTMYIAKIASDYKKPDGTTYIPKGLEEEFLDSLPIEKLWGIGAKTLSRLREAGIFTTSELRRKSKPLLESLFGNSLGQMLYDAARGGKSITFGKEAASHSISSERTFKTDISDMYLIETKLMELCREVARRMKNENIKSKTAFLKIRYNDFTTVSAQETSNSFITNSDDLFARCKNIYYRKYENGKRIRLLGVGVFAEENSSPQAELFDFADNRDQKRTKVEQAIFDMERRNPLLKVKKARSLITPEGQNNRSHRDPSG